MTVVLGVVSSTMWHKQHDCASFIVAPGGVVVWAVVVEDEVVVDVGVEDVDVLIDDDVREEQQQHCVCSPGVPRYSFICAPGEMFIVALSEIIDIEFWKTLIVELSNRLTVAPAEMFTIAPARKLIVASAYTFMVAFGKINKDALGDMFIVAFFWTTNFEYG